jgi:hypothetical protein
MCSKGTVGMKFSKNMSMDKIEHHLLKLNKGIIKHTDLMLFHDKEKEKMASQIALYLDLKRELKIILRNKGLKGGRSLKRIRRLMEL